ncbi:hypothetical protein [Anaerorhabdus sp.]|uniref:hypothetical protein n=1 Tax=Anaerorhabdus sp. TaxID=1872524 RepID=UPI002FC8970D
MKEGYIEVSDKAYLNNKGVYFYYLKPIPEVLNSDDFDFFSLYSKISFVYEFSEKELMKDIITLFPFDTGCMIVKNNMVFNDLKKYAIEINKIEDFINSYYCSVGNYCRNNISLNNLIDCKYFEKDKLSNDSYLDLLKCVEKIQGVDERMRYIELCIFRRHNYKNNLNRIVLYYRMFLKSEINKFFKDFKISFYKNFGIDYLNYKMMVAKSSNLLAYIPLVTPVRFSFIIDMIPKKSGIVSIIWSNEHVYYDFDLLDESNDELSCIKIDEEMLSNYSNNFNGFFNNSSKFREYNDEIIYQNDSKFELYEDNKRLEIQKVPENIFKMKSENWKIINYQNDKDKKDKFYYNPQFIASNIKNFKAYKINRNYIFLGNSNILSKIVIYLIGRVETDEMIYEEILDYYFEYISNERYGIIDKIIDVEEKINFKYQKLYDNPQVSIDIKKIRNNFSRFIVSKEKKFDKDSVYIFFRGTYYSFNIVKEIDDFIKFIHMEMRYSLITKKLKFLNSNDEIFNNKILQKYKKFKDFCTRYTPQND